MDRVDHNRMVKRLFMVLSGWILGGTLVFSQNHPVAIVQKEAYFPMKEVCLLDSPFQTLQQKGKEYLLWLNPDSLLHFYRIEAGLSSKAEPYAGWESQGCMGSRSFTRRISRVLSFFSIDDVSVDR